MDDFYILDIALMRLNVFLQTACSLSSCQPQQLMDETKGRLVGGGPEAQASGVNRCGFTAVLEWEQFQVHSCGVGPTLICVYIYIFIYIHPACVEIPSPWKEGRGALGGVSL